LREKNIFTLEIKKYKSKGFREISIRRRKVKETRVILAFYT
jgi:hypothetical protein